MSFEVFSSYWASLLAENIFSQISTTKLKIKTQDCMIEGRFPVIDQGQNKIAGYSNDESKIIDINKPVVIFGDHTRAVKWVDFNFIPGADGIKVLEANSQIDGRFFYHQLCSFELPDKGYARHFKFLRESVFVIPSLPEQKVIAEKLDSLLAQVESTKARLESIPGILKKFRQSVLAAAVSGELTEDWRENVVITEPAIQLKNRWLEQRRAKFEALQKSLIKEGKIKKSRNFKEPVLPDLETSGSVNVFPDSWVVISVSEMADCLDSERIPVKRDDRQVSEGLYPYFGANGEVDRVDQYIFDDDLVLVTEDETFYGREKPIAYRFTGKCWVNNHAHVLRSLTKEANDYLCFSLMYYEVIPWLSGTTGRAKLTQAALNCLPLGLPPEKEIIEIVRRVEELFGFADKVAAQVETAMASVNHLTQSILAQAFSGELTKDWREQNPDLISGENSASALLERIKAEREKLKAGKKG